MDGGGVWVECPLAERYTQGTLPAMDGAGAAMTRTVLLQIRLTPEDRERLEAAAAAEQLAVSAWARWILLRAVEEAERSRPANEATAATRPRRADTAAKRARRAE